LTSFVNGSLATARPPVANDAESVRITTRRTRRSLGPQPPSVAACQGRPGVGVAWAALVITLVGLAGRTASVAVCATCFSACLPMLGTPRTGPTKRGSLPSGAPRHPYGRRHGRRRPTARMARRSAAHTRIAAPVVPPSLWTAAASASRPTPRTKDNTPARVRNDTDPASLQTRPYLGVRPARSWGNFLIGRSVSSS
jgi:hypothetical protein